MMLKKLKKKLPDSVTLSLQDSSCPNPRPQLYHPQPRLSSTHSKRGAYKKYIFELTSVGIYFHNFKIGWNRDQPFTMCRLIESTA